MRKVHPSTGFLALAAAHASVALPFRTGRFAVGSCWGPDGMAEEEGAGSGWSSEMQSGDEAMGASDWIRDAVTTLADVPWLLERAATGDSRFAAAREGFAGGLIACVVDSCTVSSACFFLHQRAVGLIRQNGSSLPVSGIRCSKGVRNHPATRSSFDAQRLSPMSHDMFLKSVGDNPRAMHLRCGPKRDGGRCTIGPTMEQKTLCSLVFSPPPL